MDDKIRDIKLKLQEVSKLTGLYKLDFVNPTTECVLLEKNARYMTKDQLGRLTENVKKDGFLSQLPLGVKEGDKYKIISGNHRVKAAIKAGVEYIMILYVEGISKDQELGFQLSHNSISGQDDMSILMELYQEIETLDFKEYSGIDEKELLKYKALELDTISEDTIELNELRFFFCDLDFERVDRICEKLDKNMMKERNDRVIFADFYKFIDIMSDIKRKTEIKNNTVAFLKMLEICEEWLKENE